MYIETSSPRRRGDKAKLVLTIPNNGEISCLSFYYHMYGASVGTLNVYSGNSKVFNISGQQSNYWIVVERNIILNEVVREKKCANAHVVMLASVSLSSSISSSKSLIFPDNRVITGLWWRETLF